MVDMTELAAMHGSDASAKRLKSRKAAEVRLKAYGIIAILVAFMALVALLYSVVGKAFGALTESYISLPIELKADKLDPKGTGDAKEIGRADFAGLAKKNLREVFPYVKDRKAKRKLNDLISAGAAYELRDQVVADPSLVGQTVTYEFLASDVTDLYLKGFYGDLEAVETSGSLTLTQDGKTISLSSTSDDFANALVVLKERLLVEAAQTRRQAALQDNGVKAFEARLVNAVSDEDKAAAQAQVDARILARDGLIAKAEALEASAKTQGTEKLTRATPSMLIRIGDAWAKLTTLDASSATAVWLAPPSEEISGDVAAWQLFQTEQAENARLIPDAHIVWVEQLREAGAIKTVFNTRFFTSGDSREPELAGIWGAAVGSFWTMLVTFFLSFPIGVLAAIYLEEFAPKNRMTDFIEVNINNLAAVPSIVFGLLGLSIFLGVFGVPRSAPLAGGIVLALMTLPTIIIASRAAIRAVPPSIRDAALGLGASKLQTSFHHVLPLAMPG